jgi:glutaredoxin-related protein
MSNKIQNSKSQILDIGHLRFYWKLGFENWKLFMKRSIFVLIIVLLPVFAFAQSDGKKKAYYFYGENCPHCQKVDEYFQANGIYEKYEITKLEATANPFNGKLFLDFGKAFDISSWGGVPAIIFGDKYLIGDTPIIKNFTSEIDVAENAYELPDPEKIGNGENQENSIVQENHEEKDSREIPTGENESENKNNYFSIALVALVLTGGGIFTYVNRKKD